MIHLAALLRKYEGTSHQIAALNMLEDLLPTELLATDAEWIQCWQEDDNLHLNKDYNRNT